jgi:hypothetical protein
VNLITKRMKSKIFGLIIFIIILSPIIGINNYMIRPTKPSNSSLENVSQNIISLSFQNAVKKIENENPTQITIKPSNMPEELKQGKIISDSKWQFSVEPGAPQVPVRPYKILLPPGVQPDSVNIKIVDYKYVKSNTLYEYPLTPLAAILTRDGIITSVSEDVLKHNIINQFWPSKIIDGFYIHQMRDAVIVCFNYYPCSYNSETKELIEYKDVTISITWEESNNKELDPLTKSFLLNSRDDIDNLDDYLILYEPNEIPDTTYLIVTTNAIESNSQKLDDFIRYKQASGFIVEVITEDEYGSATGKQRVLNIRNWLIDNYVSKSIEYVLLIGNPDPDEEGVSDTYGDLPMLMCWPRRGAATYKESPTDYFYADLTGNWDFDGDGYYGEHIIGNGLGEDHVAGGVDYAAEVYVGRIPVYNSEYSTLDTVLQGIIDHHINSGAEKSKILLPMAISNYANEDWSGYDRTDGLDCPEEVYNNIASPKGMEDTVMYETSGLSPVPISAFHYDMPLNQANMISQMNAGHGALFWWGHGSTTSVYRKYWATDDGDGVPESAEMTWTTFLTSSVMDQLETDQPTFSYQSSCENGHPEDSNNLQYALLKRGAAVSTVSASRVSWYIIGTWSSTAWWSQYADNTGIGYYYMYNLLRSEMTSGIALYSAKFSGGASASYDGSCMNKMDFNLYGDPHLNYWGSNQPNTPSNPSPSDGAIEVSTDPTLSVQVSDPDGGLLNVAFYNATDNSLIDIDLQVSSGGIASVTWSGLANHTIYSWYVIVGDGQVIRQSATWSFTTINTAPNAPTNPVPADEEVGVSVNPTLSVDVFDLDGDPMDVSFYDASDDSLIGTDIGVSSGGTASITWFGLLGNTYYEWYTIANDSSYVTQSDTWSFTTINTAPNAPTNPVPADEEVGVSVNPTLSVDVFDPDGDPMDVSFYDASDDSLIGTDIGVLSGGTASITWSGLSEGATYEWYAIAHDGSASNQSTTWSFTVLEDSPTWDVLPTDQIIEYGDDFSYDLDASDSSGINNWWINDTVNFAIDSEGLITNIVSLSVGVYWLETRAYDAYGRYCSAIFKVTVEGEPGGGGGIPGFNLLITLAIIAILSLILIKINNQKKNFSY